jgi:hypothetical protein
MFVASYDSAGENRWFNTFGQSGMNVYARAITVNGDALYTAGTVSGEGGRFDGQVKTSLDVLAISKYTLGGGRQWTRLVGAIGNQMVVGRGVCTAPDGSVYVAGWTDGSVDGNDHPGNSSPAIAGKYSPTGEKIWIRQFAASQAAAAACGGLDGAVIAGSTFVDLGQKKISGMADIFMAGFDGSGERIWDALLGSSSGQTEGLAVAQAIDGSMYTAGEAAAGDGTMTPGTDAFLGRYSLDGALLWSVTLGGPDVVHQGAWGKTIARGVARSLSGGAYIVGETTADLDGQKMDGERDMFIAGYDAAGKRLWTRLSGHENNYGYHSAAAVATDLSGRVLVTGESFTRQHGPDVFVQAYDSAGKKLWERYISETNVSGGIAADSDGNIYVGALSMDGVSEAVVLVKLDSSGSVLWRKVATSSGYPGAVATRNDGDVYVTGYTRTSPGDEPLTGQEDAFLARYDTGGSLRWVRLFGKAESNTRVSAVATDGGGRVFISGNIFESSAFTAAFGEDGGLIGAYYFGTPGWDVTASGVAAGVDGSVFIGGATRLNLDDQARSGASDAFLIKRPYSMFD